MAAVRQAHRHANDRIEKAKSDTRQEQAKEDAGVGLASWLGGKEEKEPAPPKQVGKTGQFRVVSGGDEAFVAEEASRQIKATQPPTSDREIEAAVKLGRFALVRKRLKAISHQRRKVQHYIKAILVHACFMLVFVMNNVTSDEDRYYGASRLNEAFVSDTWGDHHTAMEDVISVSEMYDWMDEILVGNYYGSVTFDGVDETVLTRRWLLGGAYRKVGGIRVGQLRAKAVPCPLQTTLFNQTDLQKFACYSNGPYDRTNTVEGWEDRDDYGADPANQFVWEGWNGTSASARRNEFFTTQTTYPMSKTYDAPAFAFVLPQADADEASRLVAFAKNNGWVDYKTRMVIVDMTLMNAQTESLTTLRFMFAMGKGGGVLPTWEFMVSEPEPIPIMTVNFASLTLGDILVLFELLFYLYFLGVHVHQMIFYWCLKDKDGSGMRSWGRSKRLRAEAAGGAAEPRGGTASCLAVCCHDNFVVRPFNYFHALWHDIPELYQVGNMFCYGSAWFFRLSAYMYQPRNVNMDTDAYVPIRGYSEVLAYRKYPLLGASLCVFFRFLFFLAIVPRFGVITSALSRSVAAVAGWAVVFGINLVMWMMTGVALFGTRMEGFRSALPAFWTIFGMSMLGENLLEDLLAADRTFVTYIWVILFYTINTIMLLNMAIAIISDAYVEAKEAIEGGTDADVRIGREVYRYFMLRLWSVPGLGSWCKNRHLRRREAEKTGAVISRKVSQNMSLHEQLKLHHKQEVAKAKLAKATGGRGSPLKKSQAVGGGASALADGGGFGTGGTGGGVALGGGAYRRSSMTVGRSSRYVLQHDGSLGEGHGVLDDHGVTHVQRITKTAARQTLKELRELSNQVQQLSQFLHSRIDDMGTSAGHMDDFLFHQKRNAGSGGGLLYGRVQDSPKHSVVKMTEVGRVPAAAERGGGSEYGHV